MSTVVVERNRTELRKKIYESIEKMDSDELQEIRNFISQKAFNTLTDIITQGWEDGTVTDEKLEAAINKHRNKK